MNVNTYQMKTVTLNEQEWALVKEALTNLRESACDDMMHFKNVSIYPIGISAFPSPVRDYATLAAKNAADKVCQIDQLNAKLITEN